MTQTDSDANSDIVWFDQISKNDVAVVGGKGANLGEMTQAGIPVPGGFVVATSAYRRFIEQAGLDAKLGDLLGDLDVSDTAKLTAISDEVRRSMLTASMPDDISSAIAESYSSLGGGLVAVRSSATAEDLKEASFAGQHATYLNVEGETDVVEAVQRCWASLFEGLAIFYRQQQGFDHLSVDLAVPVQKMVQSETSGVMFTIDPITGDLARVMIEAVWGLGEAAVSGMVTPDSYIVSKEPLAVLESSTIPQHEQLVYSPDETDVAGEHNTWQPVPAAQHEQPKLTTEQVLELTALGLRLETHYGAPQDVEWAWAEGQFQVLQTRPVTGVASAG